MADIPGLRKPHGKAAAEIKIYKRLDVCVPDTRGKSLHTLLVDGLDQE